MSFGETSPRQGRFDLHNIHEGLGNGSSPTFPPLSHRSQGPGQAGLYMTMSCLQLYPKVLKSIALTQEGESYDHAKVNWESGLKEISDCGMGLNQDLF